MRKKTLHIPEAIKATLQPGIPLYVLSPHIDDAVWSMGGFLHALAANGYEVNLLNIFSHSIYINNSIRPPAEATSIRKGEDYEAALSACLKSVTFLDFPDGILRDTPQAAVINPNYVTPPYLLEMVTDSLLQAIPGSATLLIPAGFGGHMDHLTTRRAVLALPHPKIVYRDLPYGARDKNNGPASAFLRNGWLHTSIPLTPIVVAKHMRLFWLYRSQASPSVAGEINSYLSTNGYDLWVQ